MRSASIGPRTHLTDRSVIPAEASHDQQIVFLRSVSIDRTVRDAQPLCADTSGLRQHSGEIGEKMANAPNLATSDCCCCSCRFSSARSAPSSFDAMLPMGTEHQQPHRSTRPFIKGLPYWSGSCMLT